MEFPNSLRPAAAYKYSNPFLAAKVHVCLSTLSLQFNLNFYCRLNTINQDVMIIIIMDKYGNVR